jgi:cobaltochelatase CobN
MHLLAGEVGRIDGGETAVDPGQSPGDIVVLSAADTELTLLAEAARGMAGPTLRLCNLMRLAHPMSVDLYVEKTIAPARLVVVRMMGGAGYWTYGLDRLRALSRGGGPRLVVVSGDDRWDQGLEAFSTETPESCRRMWRYLVEGGAGNAARAVGYMAHLIGEAGDPEAPEVLPRCGVYQPGQGAVALDAARAALSPGMPVAAIVFYRSVLQGGATAPIDALVAALAEVGIAALPLFVASLKDGESRDFVAGAFAEAPPAIVLNTTAFAVSAIGASHRGTVLDAPGRPVLQVILAGSSEAEWRDSARGLLPRDLTMNVVLPEVDGRIGTRAVSFKAEAHDAATDSRIASYQPVADRIRFVAAQAAAWVRLGRTPAKDRRIAIVLSNYPNRASHIGNAVGLDTMASAVRLAGAMGDAGYDLGGFPADGAELAAVLKAGLDDAEVPPPLPSGEDSETGFARRSLVELGEGRDLSCDGPDTAIPSRQRFAPHQRRLSPPKGGQGSVSSPNGRGGRLHDGPERGGHAGDRQAIGGPASVLSAEAYAAFLSQLPVRPRAALGTPPAGALSINAHRFGNLVIAVQPSRGGEEKASLHDGDLVPTHGYVAFYAWLREVFRADAIVHLGKHGNLEWLPGKALALSAECWPELCLGPTPLVYPFIVNDPGEGAQAKRRASAVIVDHLMPPLTRAELHGPLAALETLVDEYALAAGVDRRRSAYLEREIAASAAAAGLDRDLGLAAGQVGETLEALDAYLCDLKEMQIRDGLHVLGGSPEPRARVDTLVAIARTPRSGGRPGDGSLNRAIAADLGLGGFDPLDGDLGAAWEGPRPEPLAAVSDAPWRTAGDTVERIELLAAWMVGLACGTGVGASFEARAVPEHLRMREGKDLHQPPSVGGDHLPPHPEVLRKAEPRRTHDARPGRRLELETGLVGSAAAVLDWIRDDLAPALDASGEAEIEAVLAALDGRFVRPGPSGAATRGRPEVLPTGRNFYAVDIRAVPTAAAWALGRASADAMALRYFQDQGDWPRAVAMSAWGTSNMRTGGDDIAVVLALIGAEPVWEAGTGRVTGFRVIALSELRRPRIDVTLRISGMFRDAFPEQIELIASAFRAVAALDEDEAANPIAAKARAGADAARIFGARPGAYGAGVEAMIDRGAWAARGDLAGAFLRWGGHAYGGGAAGAGGEAALAARLAEVDAVLHAQDNREHDILDSADYAEFQGGLAAAVESLRGAAPRVYHADHSRPEKPVLRPLADEIGRVVRGRATNPKWIAGMMRHGHRGAMEMATTVDLLFAYAALTDAVGDHHFDQLFAAYIADEVVQSFIADANPAALAGIAARFREAIARGLWSPRWNSAHDRLAALAGIRKEAAE